MIATLEWFWRFSIAENEKNLGIFKKISIDFQCVAQNIEGVMIKNMYIILSGL
jgi:hypothetical protein